MSNFLAAVRHLVLLIARLGLGGALLLHAYRRWAIDGIPSQIEFLTRHGVPYADVVAWVGFIGEVLAGSLLILGLLTPVVAAGVVAEQVLIICWTSWYRGPFIADRGYEYEVILAVLALVLVAFGAGAVSMDRLFRRARRSSSPVDDHDAP